MSMYVVRSGNGWYNGAFQRVTGKLCEANIIDDLEHAREVKNAMSKIYDYYGGWDVVEIKISEEIISDNRQVVSYVKRDDLIEYANGIAPDDVDYFNLGATEVAVLDKQKEIASQLLAIPYKDIEENCDE